MFSLLFRARTSTHGRPVSILLPEFPMPRLRPPRRRKSHRHRPTRQVPAVSLARLAAPASRPSPNARVPRCTAHLPEDKILSILEHIHEGCGVLKDGASSRSIPIPSATSRASGEHARDAHDELVGPLASRPASSRWMRSGRSLPRRRRTAMRTTPRPVSRGLLGPRGVRPGAPARRLGSPGERTGESVQSWSPTSRSDWAAGLRADHDRRVYGL